MDTFRTIIVTAANVDLAREISVAIDPVDCSGMFTTPLCDVDDPATITHYISTGFLNETYCDLMPCATWTQDAEGNWVQTDYDPGDPATVAAICESAQPPVEVTDAEVEAFFQESDYSTQEPFVAMGRLGLQLYSGEQPSTSTGPADTPQDGVLN